MNEHEEALVKFRAMMDQAQAMSIDLAHTLAGFYKTLMEDGIPPQTSELLTRDFLIELTAERAPEPE